LTNDDSSLNVEGILKLYRKHHERESQTALTADDTLKMAKADLNKYCGSIEYYGDVAARGASTMVHTSQSIDSNAVWVLYMKKVASDKSTLIGNKKIDKSFGSLYPYAVTIATSNITFLLVLAALNQLFQNGNVTLQESASQDGGGLLDRGSEYLMRDHSFATLIAKIKALCGPQEESAMARFNVRQGFRRMEVTTIGLVEVMDFATFCEYGSVR
jgi:hypothetical protein